MKLYFSPGACCMSCHIALVEAKIPFDLVYAGKKMDAQAKESFLKLNPLGAVPTLALAEGRVLTQNIAILEYIADQKPESHLLPKVGSYERADVMRWLSFVASDLHKAFSPLFRLTQISQHADAQHDIKNWCFATIEKYFSMLESHLTGKKFLTGDHFTIADAYLFTVCRWTKAVSFPTEQFPVLNKYIDTVASRPSVQSVLEREESYK
jgi:glutathione S-transferase